MNGEFARLFIASVHQQQPIILDYLYQLLPSFLDFKAAFYFDFFFTNIQKHVGLTN
jgi:hypothetical protein